MKIQSSVVWGCVVGLGPFFVGCASVSPPVPPNPVSVSSEVPVNQPPDVTEAGTSPPVVSSRPEETPPKEPSSQPSPEHEETAVGQILAKTIFSGLLETSYVRLTLIEESRPEQTFQLIIGDKSQITALPWERTQTVKPGYFLITLPEGRYRIQSVTIPVATTQATERMDVRFSVSAGQVTYCGTLEVSGDKERIRLGGIPVVKPGFEYTVRVKDEEEEALSYAANHFFQPEELPPLKKDLFHVVQKDNKTADE